MSFMMKTENGYIPISGNNGSSASEISYDNTDSGLKATNAQEAIDEVNEDVTTLQTEMPNKPNKSDLVGVNLLPYPYFNSSRERDGIKWTIADGTISAKGTNTATGTTSINLVYDYNKEYIFKLDKKKYIFHAKGNNVPDDSIFIWVRPAKEDGTYDTITKYFENDYAEIIIDNTNGTYDYVLIFGISILKGKTVDVENLHVQLEEGDTPHSYRPYTINNQLEDLRETKVDKTEISNMVKAPNTTTATIGQLLSVEAVSDGKPTSWKVVTSVPVANGGTGATSASSARTNLGLGSAATKSMNDIKSMFINFTNIKPYPYASTGSYTTSGITFTDDNGTVTINGTPTGNAIFRFINSSSPVRLTKTQYITRLTFNKTIPSDNIILYFERAGFSSTIVPIRINGNVMEYELDNTGGVYNKINNLYLQVQPATNPYTFTNVTAELEILEVPSNYDKLDTKITSPQTAEVGQVLAVKAVDENGKPTEWETADKPEGGGVPETTWLQLGFNKKLVWDATEAAKYNWGKRPVYGRAMTAASNTNSNAFLCFFLLNLNGTDLTIYGAGVSTSGSSTTGTTTFGSLTFQNNNSMGDKSGYIGLPTNIVERLNIRVE